MYLNLISINNLLFPLGGTWDLFKYDGVRSDSDMYTFGYSFEPWLDKKAIADGPTIYNYIKQTAEKYDIISKIRYNTFVSELHWSSETKMWTVFTTSKKKVQYRSRFVIICTGYYDYDQGYCPNFANKDVFKGQIVHPQHWPQDFDYTNKQVVIIGSGATAVTLLPQMAKKAMHVTMLQRSPTYISSLPAEDSIGLFLLAVLPSIVAHAINRWRKILFSIFFYNFCKLFPNLIKKHVVNEAHKHLGNDYPAEKHFLPKYDPWDQRYCVIPDGDLYAAIKSKKATIRTAQIECFTENGIRLKSEVTKDGSNSKVDTEGDILPADVIVTATGLQVKVAGGISITVDGKKRNLSEEYIYKGCMLSHIPNLIFSMGYVNATFTLKVDLVIPYFVRLIQYMDDRKYNQVMSVYGTRSDEKMDDKQAGRPLIALSSGYLQRASHLFPKQGTRQPWTFYQNYLYDIWLYSFGRIENECLVFS